MSDDEADPELLELLRQSLGISNKPKNGISRDTSVLKDAEFIYNNAIDVSIDMYGTRGAAASVYKAMCERGYSTQTWSSHALHPKPHEGFSDIDLANFVFTVDLLNFSFWSEHSELDRYQVEYLGQRWTGYRSLLACLRRALDEEIPITTPRYWIDERCSDDVFQYVFRSATDEEMPLLRQRMEFLRDAGRILHETFGDPEDEPCSGSSMFENRTVALDTTNRDAGSPFDAVGSVHTAPEMALVEVNLDKPTDESTTKNLADSLPVDLTTKFSPPLQDSVDHVEPPIYATNTLPNPRVQLLPDYTVVRMIEEAEHSAGKMVNLLTQHFPCFRDETRYDGRRVRLLKRAQIFVADLWAAFRGSGPGEFEDIECLTIFADYRVPQMLNALGVLVYSPPLLNCIRTQQLIEAGHSWEVQLRGCSIWAVELLRREISRQHPQEAARFNAVLIDFFLYDLAKEREATDAQPMLPHHRTRSVWY